MRFDIRDLTCYDTTIEHARSRIPFDENPVAMHRLFADLGGMVLADLDAYTNGGYDNNALYYSEKRIAMEETFRRSRQEFEEENFQLRRRGLGGSVGNAYEIRRAYDVLETVGIMNAALNIITDPIEAWDEGIRIATTTRFRREMGIILQAQKMRSLGAAAL